MTGLVHLYYLSLVVIYLSRHQMPGVKIYIYSHNMSQTTRLSQHDFNGMRVIYLVEVSVGPDPTGEL